VAIELTPNGPLTVEVTAGDRAASATLGRALAQSLGCILSGIAEKADGGQWSFEGTCTGTFLRRGDMLDGTLKFAPFRAALRALHIPSVAIDVGTPNPPYRNIGFSRNWERTLEDGVVHYTRTVTPSQLPATVKLTLGYREREDTLIFAPVGFAVLAGLALIAGLNWAAARAAGMDPRALWFSYLRCVMWGLAGIFLVWAAMWAGIAKAFGGDLDLWALYAAWHGWPAVAGKAVATLLYCLPAILVTLLSLYWRPAAFAPMELRAAARVILLPAYTWILPAYWAIAAFGALITGEPVEALHRIVLAAAGGMLLRWLVFRGRSGWGTVLDSGEVWERLCARAGKAGIGLTEVHVLAAADAWMATPVDVWQGRVALSDYAMEAMPAEEIEAAVARQWSMPLRRLGELRGVLLLFGGLAMALVVTHPLHIRSVIAAPLVVGMAAAAAWGVEWWLGRRAGAGAPALWLPPWRWTRAAETAREEADLDRSEAYPTS
jgi:hypothetical protein